MVKVFTNLALSSTVSKQSVANFLGYESEDSFSNLH
jgi:hypothetical protein